MNYNPLQKTPTDNTGLYETSTISKYLDGKNLDGMSKALNGMRVNHESFFEFRGKIMGDKTLTNEAKDLLIGQKGVKVKDSFINFAADLTKEAKGHLNTLNNSLYTNTSNIDGNQIMMVGLVGEQLKKEGLEYLDRSEYVHPIAVMMAKAELLPHGQGEMVLDKLNRKHSSDTLSEISGAEAVLKSVEATINEESRLFDMHTPTSKELASLQASSALTEVKKLTGGV